MQTLRNQFLIIIVLLSMAIGSSTLTRGHEWGDDWASYVMQAQSILNGKTGEFITHNTFTIFKSSFQIGPVAYPWGYPLILTSILAIKGIHPLTLKLPGLVFFAGFLICLYFLIKDRLTRTESLLLVSLFAFNPMLIKFLDQILSDIPFLFFIFLGLLLITKLKPNMKNSVALGAIIFFAFFIRTTGIILLASYLAYQALSFYRQPSARKTISINSALVIFSFGVLAILTSLIFPNGQGSYFQQLKDLTFAIFIGNIVGYFHLFVIFFGDGLIWNYIYYLLVIFFLIGAWICRESDEPLIIFFALYFVAIIFWPEWQGPRFIFPLLPIFLYFALQGVLVIINQLPKNYHSFSTGISFAFWIAIIGIFLFTSTTRAYSNVKNNRKINGPFDPYSSDVFNYIKEKTPSDSVIVFYKPRAMRLFTDRNTLMSTECDRLKLGNYVVISYKAENSQIPPDKISKCGLNLRNVFENQRFIVYEIPK